MKVTMVSVCSADGKMTRGDDPLVQHWSSKEDFAHFMELINAHKLLVMGRKTFEAVEPHPQPERLRVVLTSTPDDFAAAVIPGQLEFSSAAPRDLVASLEGRGYDSLLLLGGGHVNAAFLQAGLVNELYMTIEPVLFGMGTPMVDGAVPNVQLQLLDTRPLNDTGTLLLHYVVKPPVLDRGASAQ